MGSGGIGFCQRSQPCTSLQVIHQCRALGVCRALGFKEVGLYHIGIGVLPYPFHVLRLFPVVVIEEAETEA